MLSGDVNKNIKEIISVSKEGGCFFGMGANIETSLQNNFFSFEIKTKSTTFLSQGVDRTGKL